MRVEAALVHRAGATKGWEALLEKDMRPRTAIGVLVMFFQRE
jgi:hypothetical protein